MINVWKCIWLFGLKTCFRFLLETLLGVIFLNLVFDRGRVDFSFLRDLGKILLHLLIGRNKLPIRICAMFVDGTKIIWQMFWPISVFWNTTRNTSITWSWSVKISRFLYHWFYVKSISRILEVQELPFLPFQGLWILFIW